MLTVFFFRNVRKFLSGRQALCEKFSFLMSRMFRTLGECYYYSSRDQTYSYNILSWAVKSFHDSVMSLVSLVITRDRMT
jgi:hypothetical protein